MEKANDQKHRRAALMAELFLQDLGASVWATGTGGLFDLIGVLRTTGNKFRLVAIDVKAAENVSGAQYRFRATRDSANALRHSNVPLLVFVADVKNNTLYFGWASEIRIQRAEARQRSAVTCVLPIRPAAEKKEQLLDSIVSLPDFSQPVARAV